MTDFSLFQPSVYSGNGNEDKKKVNSPLDNLQSSLAVKTPEAEMVSLQMTSLKGFRGYPTKSRNEFLALNVGIFEARMGGNSLVGTCGKTPCQMGQPWETSPSSLSLIHWQEQIQRIIQSFKKNWQKILKFSSV